MGLMSLLAALLPAASTPPVLAGEVTPSLVLPAGTRLVDVRTPAEWADGHLPGATLLPLDQLAARVASVLPDRNAPIVVYCRSGNRSGQAQRFLRSLGYTNVENGGGATSLAARLGKPLVRD